MDEDPGSPGLEQSGSVSDHTPASALQLDLQSKPGMNDIAIVGSQIVSGVSPGWCCLRAANRKRTWQSVRGNDRSELDALDCSIAFVQKNSPLLWIVNRIRAAFRLYRVRTLVRVE